MTSAVGEAKKLSAEDVCEIWLQGFIGLDAVLHKAGHYLFTVNGDNADIYWLYNGYSYKKAASKGNSRMFVGSYDLKALKSVKGWRLTQFKYNVKYIDRNILYSKLPCHGPKPRDHKIIVAMDRETCRPGSYRRYQNPS